MPIDKDNLIIFVHIPKCAGNTMEKILNIHGHWKDQNMNILYGVHNEIILHSLPLEYYPIYVDINLIRECKIYTVCRNPYDRALSDYMWYNRKCKTFYDFLLLVQITLRIYDKSNLITLDTTLFRNHFISQYEYINSEFKNNVIILRLENLNNDIKQYFNIDNILHENRTNHVSWKKYMFDKPECINIINELYENDFIKLGYKMIK